jgi:lysophospholipase
MIPAAANFEPLPIQAVGARLRAARFAADPKAPPRGVCVLLNGQTEFIEKYFEVIDELRQRGFAVATMDWRGQGGSSRALDDPRKGYVKDFAEYDEDLQTLMDWIVTPMLEQVETRLPHVRSAVGGGGRSWPSDQRRPDGAELIAVAHSMGAHNLLRYLTRKPDAFSAVVLSAPMIAVSLRGTPEWLARAVTLVSNRTGRGGEWVWGMEDRDPHRMTFDRQIVTSDSERFTRAQMILRENPDLRLSGATWSWLAAAFRSMDWLRAKGRAESITTPALVIGAGADRIVLTAEAEKFAARMPHATYVAIPGAEHEILMERDALRRQWWAAFDSFMNKTLRQP